VTEDTIVCHHEPTGRWFSINDSLAARAVEPSSADEEVQYDTPNLTMKELHRRNMFLIKGAQSSSKFITYCLMVKRREDDHILVSGGSEDKEALHVYARRSVFLAEFDCVFARGLDAFRELAIQAVNHQLTQTLAQTPDTNSVVRQTAVADVKELMKNLATRAFDNDTRVKECISTRFRKLSRDSCWKMILWFPFDVTVHDMPEDQCWVVDRELENDRPRSFH